MLKPRVIVVHGIHTNVGAHWMDAYVDAFRAAGFPAEKHTYGYAYALLTRLQNPGRASALCDLVRPGDVLVGHSNGGCLAWMAAELGAPLGGAVLLNPALDTDKVLDRRVPWVNLYCNRHDEAVRFAGVFPRHPWGAQGRDGLSVLCDRYRTTFTDRAQRGVPAIRGHSAVLDSPEWLGHVVRGVEARLGNK